MEVDGRGTVTTETSLSLHWLNLWNNGPNILDQYSNWVQGHRLRTAEPEEEEEEEERLQLRPGSRSLRTSLGFLVQMKVPLTRAKEKKKWQKWFLTQRLWWLPERLCGWDVGQRPHRPQLTDHSSPPEWPSSPHVEPTPPVSWSAESVLCWGKKKKKKTQRHTDDTTTSWWF